MRIMLASDGSEDGLSALELVASLRAPEADVVVTFVVGWPPRTGPMWRAVYERQFIADDLHRALEETVEYMTERLRRIAGALAREVTSRVEDGDAAEQLAAAIERERIDLLIVGLTGGPDRLHGRHVMDELMSRTRIPIVGIYGAAR
jgi:nucleotide-binding universal stress UspA family protein